VTGRGLVLAAAVEAAVFPFVAVVRAHVRKRLEAHRTLAVRLDGRSAAALTAELQGVNHQLLAVALDRERYGGPFFQVLRLEAVR
jgi:hypothetical protein